MTADPAPALLALSAALAAWPPGRGRVVERVRALWPAGAAPAGDPAGGTRETAQASATARRRWVLAAVAGTAAGLLMGGASGLAAAALVAVGVERLLRARAADDLRSDRVAMSRDLPAACDLLAVCLAAGVPVSGALAAVGAAVPAPLGPQLAEVAGLYRLGAEPRRAWADAADPLAALGRVLVRAGESGAAVAPSLRSLAADTRASARAGTEAAVRRAGVWILAPLGLCFLPAFVCLGVVPLVLGIAAGVFG